MGMVPNFLMTFVKNIFSVQDSIVKNPPTGKQSQRLNKLIENALAIASLNKTGMHELLERDDEFKKKLSELIVHYSNADKRFGLYSVFLVTIPEYNSDTQLKKFTSSELCICSSKNEMIDENFPEYKNRLTAGKTYLVEIYIINNLPGRETKSQDCEDFLRKKQSIFVGPQGLTLIWELAQSEFPRGHATRAYEDSLKHGVAEIYPLADGKLSLCLSDFKLFWDSSGALLCVREYENEVI